MKKIIIIVTTILLLGLLGFYFIKEDKNLENPNNDYNEIDVNEKSNDTVVNDNVELLKVKDKKLEELVYLNKDNDLIEISKQDYLKLLKIHQDEIILFNKDDELIFSGKLIEDNNKFYLLRAKLEEIVSSIDYQVEQEENQSIERKLLSSSNNGIKLQDKRYFAHDIESSKNNDNYELLLQIRLLAELELSLSNLKVGISINPFKNKYKFDYSYDYQIKLDYKNENRLRIGELAKQIEKYQEKLKPQVEPDFNQGIKTTLFNQAIFNSDEIKRYELENPDKGGYGFNGISERLFEQEIFYLTLPALSIKGLKGIIGIPIIVYIDLDGYIEFELSQEIKYLTKSNYSFTFDNKRSDKVQVRNRVIEEESTNKVILSGKAAMDFNTGLAIQFEILNVKFVELSFSFDSSAYGAAVYAQFEDRINETKMNYTNGYLKYVSEFNINASYGFGFEGFLINFKNSGSLNILNIPILTFETGSLSDGTFNAYHRGNKLAIKDYEKYKIDPSKLIDGLKLKPSIKEELNESIEESNKDDQREVDLKSLKLKNVFYEGKHYFEDEKIVIYLNFVNEYNIVINEIEFIYNNKIYTVSSDKFIENTGLLISFELMIDKVVKNIDKHEFKVLKLKVNHLDKDDVFEVLEGDTTIDVNYLGKGTKLDPLMIYKEQQLINLNKDVNIKLYNDLDFDLIDEVNSIKEYDAVFDGNNKTIKNLRLYGDQSSAIINQLGKNGVIKNLNIEDSISYSDFESAILVINNYGLIDNINFYNNKVETKEYGAIVSVYNFSEIINIEISNSSVKSESDDSGLVSGINFQQTLIQNINVSESEISGNNNIGGIVGKNQGAIREVVISSIKVSGNSNIGGAVGTNSSFRGEAEIYQVRVDGVIRGNKNGGAIVGYFDSGELVKYFISKGTIYDFKDKPNSRVEAVGYVVGGFIE